MEEIYSLWNVGTVLDTIVARVCVLDDFDPGIELEEADQAHDAVKQDSGEDAG